MPDTSPDAAPAAPPAFVRPPYDPLTIALHWLTVLLVVFQLALGLSFDSLAPEIVKPALTVHRSAGVLLWLVVAFRLAWRFTGMKLPPFPPAMARWHILGVHLSEYGLYGLLLAVPIAGLGQTALKARPFDLFLWRVPALAEKNLAAAKLMHDLHALGAWALLALAGVHAFAALVHHFVLKDGVLRSMLPGGARAV